MTNGGNRGFTLLEIMIVVGLLAIFVAMAFPPLFSSLQIAGRESTMLGMDQSANRAINAVTAELRQAVLPVVIPNDRGNYVEVGDDALAGDIGDFVTDSQTKPLSLLRFMNNKKIGFGTNGQAWLAVLLEGTDFIPFAIPVPYSYDDATSSVTTLDSALLPQLGIILPDGRPVTGAVYTVESVAVDGGENTRTRYLWNSSLTPPPANPLAYVSPLHYTLTSLVDPAALGLVAGDLSQPVNLTDSRFTDNMDLYGAEAFGAIRFVPYVDGTGGPHIITEGPGVDLNEDGTTTDSYAAGRIELVYFIAAGATNPSTLQKRTVSGNMILLQLNNRTSASYRPLFKLRRQPSGGFVMDVNLLLYDEAGQSGNVIAFGASTVPYLTRRYSSSVELRNMSIK